jgi:hypothetical protein
MAAIKIIEMMDVSRIQKSREAIEACDGVRKGLVAAELFFFVSGMKHVKKTIPHVNGRIASGL